MIAPIAAAACTTADSPNKNITLTDVCYGIRKHIIAKQGDEYNGDEVHDQAGFNHISQA